MRTQGATQAPTPDGTTHRKSNVPWQELVIGLLAEDEEKIRALQRALCKLVRLVAGRRPSRVYTEEHSWNKDACTAVATEVLIDQIEKGYLHKYQWELKSDWETFYYFRRAIVMCLNKMAKKSPSRNFCRRTQRILREDTRFKKFGTHRWGLAEWDGLKWRRLSPETLEERLLWISLEPSPDTRRNSPSSVEIAVATYQLLKAVAYPATLSQIVSVLEDHFRVFDIDECSWPLIQKEEGGEVGLAEFGEDKSATSQPPPPPDVLLTEREKVEDWVGKLDEESLLYLEGLFLKGTEPKDLAGPGRRRSTVSNRKRALERKLADLKLNHRVRPYVYDWMEEIVRRRRQEPYEKKDVILAQRKPEPEDIGTSQEANSDPKQRDSGETVSSST